MYIEGSRLVKHYGKRKIVDQVDVAIQAGEILAIIGPNGAGKTTLLELLIGLRKPDRGTIRYFSNSFRAMLGVQLQSVPFFPGLSALENLQLFAAFYKKTVSNEEAMDCLRACGITDAAHTEAAKLSGGQQKRLAIAVAIIHHPELIVLDEPTAALDPRARLDIHQLVQELNKKGKTILFTSHDMDEVQQLATRIIVMDQGSIIVQGEPAKLCAQYELDSLSKLYITLMKERKQHV